jgi:hypothetical protein
MRQQTRPLTIVIRCAGAIVRKRRSRYVHPLIAKYGRLHMKFMVSWTVPQGTFNAAVARFLETGGAPPEGVKMLGRWHSLNGHGFAISESSDPKAMYRWVTQWADLLPLTVSPCLEDADAGEVMASLPKR